jgi:hypothetical protein
LKFLPVGGLFGVYEVVQFLNQGVLSEHGGEQSLSTEASVGSVT